MKTPLQSSAPERSAAADAKGCGTDGIYGRTGFTLVEVMTATAVFTLLAMGITSSVMQTYRLSQLNILRTAAYTVAQGYLEQMKSIDPGTLESASEPWVSSRIPIPTESVSALTLSNTNQLNDYLYTSPISTVPNGANMTARAGVSTDMWNVKQIMIDLTSNTTTNVTTANSTPVTMTMYIDVNISRAWTQTGGSWLLPQQPYFLISLDFQYKSNGYMSGNWQTGNLRMISTNIPGN